MDLMNKIANVSSNAESEISKIERQALDCVTSNLSNAENSTLALTNQIRDCL